MQWDRLVAPRYVYSLEKGKKKKDQIVIYVTSTYTVSFIGEMCFFPLIEKWRRKIPVWIFAIYVRQAETFS